MRAPIAEYKLRVEDQDRFESALASLPAFCDDRELLAHVESSIRPIVPAGRMREAVRAIRQQVGPPALLISAFRVSKHVGPTPYGWRDADWRATLREDAALLTVASCLGEVFGWASLQNGALVQTIAPTREGMDQQSGAGSRTPLEWHVEDAFSEHRPDYLALMGIRNNDHVATTVGTLYPSCLSTKTRRLLRTPRFLIRPDDIHLEGASLAAEAFNTSPVAILTGPDEQPHLRVDPPFTAPLPGDDEAAAALAELTAVIDCTMSPVAIGAGDILIIDNHRAVHGREPFTSRFDGTDRWLRKSIVKVRTR